MRMGSAIQRAYVFVCGQAEYVGLSVMKDGTKIPPCVSPPHKWKRVDEIPLDVVAFTQLDINPAIAVENLIARVSRCTARR